jgi:hypothetical protein
MDTPTPEERARRARAAWGYSRLDVGEFAKLADIKADTFGNYMLLSEVRPPSMPQLYKIVAAAGIPRSFADYGFGTDPVIERLDRLEASTEALLAALEIVFAALETTLSAPAARSGAEALQRVRDNLRTEGRPQ